MNFHHPIQQRKLFSSVMRDLPGIFGIRKNEGPRFYVIAREGEKQIRRYRPFVIALVSVKGSYQNALLAGSEKLKSYMAGNNRSGTQLDLLTPLLMGAGYHINFEQVETKTEGWTLGLILPSRFSLAEAPVPNEKSVMLLKIPSLLAGALRFRGQNTEALMFEKRNELLKWASGLRAYGVASAVRFAHYHAITVLPMFRRHEAQITLSPPKIPLLS